MKNLVIGIGLCILLLPTHLTAQEITVSDIQVAATMNGQQPSGVDTSFTTDIGRVICFTQIEGVVNKTKIFQVWYYKDEERARIALDVEADQWQIWGSKSIMESSTGPWRVMIEDTNGNVLGTTSFHITKASNP